MVLVFHFTVSFSGCLQRRFYNLVEHVQVRFFADILNAFKLLTIEKAVKKAPSQIFDWVENTSLAKGYKH